GAKDTKDSERRYHRALRVSFASFALQCFYLDLLYDLPRGGPVQEQLRRRRGDFSDPPGPLADPRRTRRRLSGRPVRQLRILAADDHGAVPRLRAGGIGA